MMLKKDNSILVIGFNTRPIVYSLYKAGYKVYSVDFFGDLDLHQYIEDAIILTEKLDSNYNNLKEFYKKYLMEFTFEIIEKYPEIDSIILASGLDDEINERKKIYEFINEKDVKNLNNRIKSIEEARDIKYLFNILKNEGYEVPKTEICNLTKMIPPTFKFPFILKKYKSSGGINVHKIKNEEDLNFQVNLIRSQVKNESEYIIQEFIDGLPVSCTIISDGNHTEVISINRQIIGLSFLNPSGEFYYCGNIVPAYLLPKDIRLISEISLSLAEKLKLKGINGFDFVLKNHYPYLMEINPRIPGSIRASEESYGINLMDLHIKSFQNDWKLVKKTLKKKEPQFYCTKLIYFAPIKISKPKIKEINKLNFIHDKSNPRKVIQKGSPVCTILYKDNNFNSSYFGSLKIADKISRIILNNKKS
ncbi:MAG: ATP-grasp domain-containing protein [Candidatus Lokiarchaeota archaeon]